MLAFKPTGSIQNVSRYYTATKTAAKRANVRQLITKLGDNRIKGIAELGCTRV